jgi:tRNA C32,U32 (ribose-2'-O)-methylase TrmJ
MALTCHYNAAKKKMVVEENRIADAFADAFADANPVSTTTAIDRHAYIADMMNHRVCPMLPSAMELGREKSNSPATQLAHAVKEICSPLC